MIGQETDFIDGKLVNSEDNTPIPFATILIKNKAKGLISNIDGGFKIPYELRELSDTLVISSIGYSSREVPLLKLQKNQINVITLDRKIEILDGVLVVASKKKERKNARKIIQLAINNIPENYPLLPFSYIGYYRDYQIIQEKYVNLNEAILQVFDPGFDFYDLKETQSRIYTYKKNPAFQIDTIAAAPYDYVKKKKIIPNARLGIPGGNEFTLLRLHDAIRNYNKDSYDYVNRLNVDFIKNHQLKKLPDTYIDDIPLYSIGITKTLENIHVDGTIFISKGDFKIYKMQYAVYDKSNAARSRSNSKPNREFQGKLLFEIILEYQLYNDIMYPNYISFNNSFESLQPAKFIPIALEVNAKKHFKLTFNNTPLRKDAMKKRNYKLWYKNERLKIDSISVKDNAAFLFLDKSKMDKIEQMYRSRRFNEDDFSIKVKNIRDVYDNVVFLQEYISCNQFREFFVQEINLNTKKPLDSLYMRKAAPINLNQPIAPFKNLKDYWMNTPLKN